MNCHVTLTKETLCSKASLEEFVEMATLVIDRFYKSYAPMRTLRCDPYGKKFKLIVSRQCLLYKHLILQLGLLLPELSLDLELIFESLHITWCND